MINLYDEDGIFESMDVISPFVCLLCLGVAQRPLKCSECETVYCTGCIFPKVKSNKVYACFKMCGSSKLLPLSRIERNILNSIEFKCEQQCGMQVRYEDMKKHLMINCETTKLVFDQEEEDRLKKEYDQAVAVGQVRVKVVPAPVAAPVAPEEEENVDIGAMFEDNDDEY